MGELGLDLHPDKTRVVDLREGKQGFDFLGCHFRARVKALTGRHRFGMELRAIIDALTRFLRGWGNYFRTGNAAQKFRQMDRYVTWRLHRLMVKRRGRNLRAGQADHWTETWFHDQGLHQLLGTIRYPKAA